MICKNGPQHTHATVIESRACWNVRAACPAKSAAPAADVVWCEAHQGLANPHVERPDCVHPHFVDEATRARTLRVARLAVQYGPATEGMYRKDGQIYKVLVAIHGSGRLYAQKLVDGHFEVVKGAVRTLTQEHRMTVQEAAAYGKLYGTCVRCQTALTDPDSIARGMGPVCAGKI